MNRGNNCRKWTIEIALLAIFISSPVFTPQTPVVQIYISSVVDSDRYSDNYFDYSLFYQVQFLEQIDLLYFNNSVRIFNNYCRVKFNVLEQIFNNYKSYSIFLSSIVENTIDIDNCNHTKVS